MNELEMRMTDKGLDIGFFDRRRVKISEGIQGCDVCAVLDQFLAEVRSYKSCGASDKVVHVIC